MKKEDLERFETKLDTIQSKIASIDVTLATQSVVLEEHVRRTNALERKIEPVENHVRLMKSLAKIIVFMGLGVVLKIIHAMVIK